MDSCIVTYLEHSGPPPQQPDLNIEKVIDPTRAQFDELYSGVGDDYQWTDLHEEDGAGMDRYLRARQRYLYRLLDDHQPAGFYSLSARAEGEIELDYFGLMPHAIGRGFGGRLLEHAIAEAFMHHGAKKLFVNTCTLDHPRALPLYKAKGFVPVSTKTQPLTS